MTILFVLLTFLVIMSITYYTRRDVPAATVQPPIFVSPEAPRMMRDLGFEIPSAYAFHPGHTWVMDEGRQNARIGVDAFATNLLGDIEKIEVAGLNRWVRQGQKIATATTNGLAVDVVSPVEGVIIAVNPEILRDPNTVSKDPYKDGWVCVVKSPDLQTNLKNLLTGSMVGPWLQNSVRAVTGIASQAVARAADGGMPIRGLLSQLPPEQQKAVIREVFLTER